MENLPLSSDAYPSSPCIYGGQGTFSFHEILFQEHSEDFYHPRNVLRNYRDVHPDTLNIMEGLVRRVKFNLTIVFHDLQYLVNDTELSILICEVIKKLNRVVVFVLKDLEAIVVENFGSF